jgi:hypothetical protein
LEGITKKITIRKKIFDPKYLDSRIINEIDIFKCDCSTSTFRWDIIKDKLSFSDNEIYVCPFGIWNFQTVKYIKEYNNSYKEYNYRVEPLQKNEKIYYISNDGKISLDRKKSTYFNFFGIKNYPLFGICGKEWYPLINENEKEELFFIAHEDINKLKKIYLSMNKGYISFKHYKNEYFLESDNFSRYLYDYFPETFDCLKKSVCL